MCGAPILECDLSELVCVACGSANVAVEPYLGCDECKPKCEEINGKSDSLRALSRQFVQQSQE